ncbi:TraB/GumN family protein [Ponticoccus gilvus]|nr:TraB/GumN family protein [Enemella evansiae]
MSLVRFPLKALVAGLAALAAGPTLAQDWATRAVCDVPQVALYEDTLDAPLAELERQAAKIPNGLGRFWRITAPGGAVSHLWGTFHSTQREVLDLPDMVLAEIARAKTVALEIDPVYPSRAAYYADVTHEGRYIADGQPSAYNTLSLDPRVDGWIRDRLDGIGWGRDSTDYLTLGALMEVLLWSPCEDFASGTYPTQDTLIQTLGHIKGARIVGLEPAQRIRQKLDGTGGRSMGAAMLTVYGSYLAPVEDWKGSATGFALYLQGRSAIAMMQDRARIETLFGEAGLEQLDYLDGWLLDERNHDFVEAAAPALDAGGAFVAVGNFHLPGEAGMVALLRDRGYRVERVAVPGEVQTP